MKKIDLLNFKKYIIWFFILISLLWWFTTYAYTSNGTIWDLFEKIGWSWYLIWSNIKDSTITVLQLADSSIITSKILNSAITQIKVQNWYTDLSTNQTIAWIKTFNSSPLVPYPTSNSQIATKKYVDDVVASIWTSTPTSTFTFSWQSSTWNTCSASCWWWTQTRTVQCIRNDGASALDSSCSWTKPISSQSCNTQSCSAPAPSPTYSYSWQSLAWSTCSATCWWWTQTRTVQCLRNDWVLVIDSYCTTTKPITSQSCNTTACWCNWGTGQWNSPDWTKICTWTWNYTAANSYTTASMTNWWTLNWTCLWNNTWSWNYTCPNAPAQTICVWWWTNIKSTDNTNTCYFSRGQWVPWNNISITGTNWWTASLSCWSSWVWTYTASCPWTKISCPQWWWSLPSASWKTTCYFSRTSSLAWVTKTVYSYNVPTWYISATCQNNWTWGVTSTYCP